MSSPLLPDRLPKGVNEKPTDCFSDANANQNKCGENAKATCVGSHGLGECCGKAGWCGTGPAYCEDGVQADYSHGKGLCAAYGGLCPTGLTLEQVISVTGHVERLHSTVPGPLRLPPPRPPWAAVRGLVALAKAPSAHIVVLCHLQAWMDAIAPINRDDAAAMCVPAVIVAAGSSYDTDICKGKFHPTQNKGKVNGTKGLWQIRFGYHDEPAKQAETVYRVYTGNNPDNGCMSGWCQGSGCAEPHWAFGQDNNTMETHRFCRGMWTEKPHVYEDAIEKVGGIDMIRNKCSAAASSRGLGVVGNGMRPPQTAQEQQLSDYLMQKLREIFLESAAAPLASRVVEAMAMKGVSSLEDAAEAIGKADVAKAEEVVQMARVDTCAHTCLEPQLLKEWLESFLHQKQA